MNRQIDKYLNHFEAQEIVYHAKSRGFNSETTFDEVFESGDFDIDELSELCGR